MRALRCLPAKQGKPKGLDALEGSRVGQELFTGRNSNSYLFNFRREIHFQYQSLMDQIP
jgi:hypothetical protein